MADGFKTPLTVGDHMTWQFYYVPAQDGLPENVRPKPAGRTTFVVAAIVDVSPALVDTFDNIESAILPPAATARYLKGEWQFGWASLRLRRGGAGVSELRKQLAGLATAVSCEAGFPKGFPPDQLHHPQAGHRPARGAAGY